MTRIGRQLGRPARRRVALLGVCLILTVVTALMTTTRVANASTVAARWHTAYGNHLYITTDGTTPYGAAESGNPPGRILTSTSGNSYNDPSGLCAQSPMHQCLVWNLTLDSGYCLAATNSSFNIDIKPCDADGTAWALLIRANGTDQWISRDISNAEGTDYVMTGDNAVGGRLTTDCEACTSGDYQAWVPVTA